jgi:hypothetical protein
LRFSAYFAVKKPLKQFTAKRAKNAKKSQRVELRTLLNRPLHGLDLHVTYLIPPMNRWATVSRPLRGLAGLLLVPKMPSAFDRWCFGVSTGRPQYYRQLSTVADHPRWSGQTRAAATCGWRGSPTRIFQLVECRIAHPEYSSPGATIRN